MNIDKPTCATDNMSDSSDKRFVTDAKRDFLDSCDSGNWLPDSMGALDSVNVSGSGTTSLNSWSRVGNTVSCGINFNIDTFTTGAVHFGYSLPVAPINMTAPQLQALCFRDDGLLVAVTYAIVDSVPMFVFDFTAPDTANHYFTLMAIYTVDYI